MPRKPQPDPQDTTTKDALDAGVPMAPGKPDEATGPEDAFGAEPTRGDYSDRMDQGPHLVSEEIPENERVEGGPTSRLVEVSKRVKRAA